MADEQRGIVGAGVSIVLAAAAAFLAASDGSRQVLTSGEDTTTTDTGAGAGSTPEQWAEGIGDLVGRAVRSMGARGGAVRERIEGLYGIYRLLRALGMSDAEIATLVAEQARQRLGRGLPEPVLSAEDARRVLDGVQDTVVRAAQEVDVRLDLGGDFVRGVREAALAARAGREDAFVALERGVGAAREHLRRVLNGQE